MVKGKNFGFTKKEYRNRVGESSQAHQVGVEIPDNLGLPQHTTSESSVDLSFKSSKESSIKKPLSHLSNHEDLMLQAFQCTSTFSSEVTDHAIIMAPDAVGSDPVKVMDSENDSMLNSNQAIPEGELLNFDGEDLSYLLDPIAEEGEISETEEYDGSGHENMLDSMVEIGNEEGKALTDSEEKKEDQNRVSPVKKKRIRAGAGLAGASSKNAYPRFWLLIAGKRQIRMESVLAKDCISKVKHEKDMKVLSWNCQ